MRSQEFKLNTVSTCFMHGADNSKTSVPELRAPAIRGVMRYWFRAVAGGLLGDRKLLELHQIESQIFGNTEVGSTFQIRIPHQNLQIEENFLLPHHKRALKNGLKADQSFRIILSAQRPVNDILWDSIISTFEAAVAFGGFGLRSRRGYGVLQLSGSKMIQNNDIWAEEMTRIAQTVVKNIQNMAESAGFATIQLANEPTSFPCINKKGIVAIGRNPYPNAQAAVIGFMDHVPQKKLVGIYR